MRIEIRGDKLDITESIRSHIESKLGKLNVYFTNPEEIKAYVVVRARNKEEIVEITIPTPKFSLRIETTHEDLYAAVDLSVDKLERQIRKNKTKMRKKFKETVLMQLEEQEEQEISFAPVKRKTLELKPMDEEEAILQMELVDHDFYLFKNSEEDNKICVVYKRKDGTHGIISAE